MPDDTATVRHSNNNINVPGFRAAGRRLGSNGWVTQYDGVVRPVTAADLQHRDEMARDVVGREREASAMARETSDPTMRASCLKAIATYRAVLRELRQLYSGGGDATSTRHCSPLPMRRNTRRTPRRTRSTRTVRATTSSSAGDGEPPEPEPPGSRRYLLAEVAP